MLLGPLQEPPTLLLVVFFLILFPPKSASIASNRLPTSLLERFGAARAEDDRRKRPRLSSLPFFSSLKLKDCQFLPLPPKRFSESESSP